jgi:hypothetical protein
MTSKIKVDNINKVSDDSNIIKKCGTTTTIGSGASNPIVVDGSAVTIGRCGGTVALASGATQTGFGRSGSVNWQTTPKTSTFTAVNGEGYFINQGSAITVNLPAGSAGAIVAVSDYARNFETYNLTIAPNGSEKIGGVAAATLLNVNGQAATFVYVDSTKGWVNVQNAEDTEIGATFITATGGTITTVCTNFKIHTFTGPGTFTVCSVGNPSGSNTVDYLVVGSGGGGSGIGTGANNQGAGGGGAGGVRASATTFINSGPSSPRTSGVSALPVTAQGYPITVGSGGTAGPTSGPRSGGDGNTSTFSIITAAGGGAATGCCTAGNPGGSGGGGGRRCGADAVGGSGNTPPVAPPQGEDGGKGRFTNPSGGSGGGGGGLMAVGGDGGYFTPSPTYTGGAGGVGGGFPTAFGPSNGAPNPSPPDSFRYFGGGGGGGQLGAGGLGGGGTAGPCSPGTAAGESGTANTGGGGASGVANALGSPASATGGAGGSGVVIIRYRFQ